MRWHFSHVWIIRCFCCWFTDQTLNKETPQPEWKEDRININRTSSSTPQALECISFWAPIFLFLSSQTVFTHYKLPFSPNSISHIQELYYMCKCMPVICGSYWKLCGLLSMCKRATFHCLGLVCVAAGAGEYVRSLGESANWKPLSTS